eukprot:2812594-Amphidinium_carterae.1
MLQRLSDLVRGFEEKAMMDVSCAGSGKQWRRVKLACSKSMQQEGRVTLDEEECAMDWKQSTKCEHNRRPT